LLSSGRCRRARLSVPAGGLRRRRRGAAAPRRTRGRFRYWRGVVAASWRRREFERIARLRTSADASSRRHSSSKVRRAPRSVASARSVDQSGPYRSLGRLFVQAAPALSPQPRSRAWVRAPRRFVICERAKMALRGVAGLANLSLRLRASPAAGRRWTDLATIASGDPLAGAEQGLHLEREGGPRISQHMPALSSYLGTCRGQISPREFVQRRVTEVVPSVAELLLEKIELHALPRCPER